MKWYYVSLVAACGALGANSLEKRPGYTLTVKYLGRECSPTIEIKDSNNEVLFLNNPDGTTTVNSGKLESRLRKLQVQRVDH